MPYGEGANWEGPQQIQVSDGVTFDLLVEPDRGTGSVRVRIEIDDSPEIIASNLASEWNARQPLKDVIAFAEEGSSLTAFFLTGPLADGQHEIKSMGAAFDGKAREEMLNVGDSVSSLRNNTLKVTRTDIDVTALPATVMASAAMTMQADQVVPSSETTQPVQA